MACRAFARPECSAACAAAALCYSPPVPPPLHRIGIVPRKGHAAAVEVARELCAWLRARGREVVVEDDVGADVGAPRVDERALAEFADLVVVLGGDGTPLHAAKVVGRRPTPLFGVNLGSLGFMTEIPQAELYDNLAEVLEGRYAVEARLKLDVSLLRGGKAVLEEQVLNDVVLSKGAVARIGDFEASIDGTFVTRYKADGVIVATPTGSTAYSLAANGPIVYPTLDAMVVNPICPHTLTQRPIVVPPDRAITLELASDFGDIFLTLDGRGGVPLHRGDRVRVVRSEDRMFLVKNPRLDYFSILRAKLRWGER